MTSVGSGTTALTTTATEGHVVLSVKVPPTKYRKDYKQPLYFIKHVNLDFDLGYEKTLVRSTLDIYRAPNTPAGVDLILDGEELKLLDVELKGEKLQISPPLASSGQRDCYVDSDGRLVISGKLLPGSAEEVFKVSTVVEVCPMKNLALMGLFKSGSILVTQCEAEGFRRITYFLDRPDVMSTYRVRLCGNKQEFPVLLSNGNEVESGGVDGDDNKHYAIFVDPFPKPCYLFCLVAGQLAKLSGEYQNSKKADGKKVALHVWSEESQIPKLEWSMESLKRAMQWDEDTFGLEYDLNVFNIVCVRDFNMGAMENKSLNVFVSSLLLATPETSTDVDYLRILRVVGHEYFHNWTGDRVTCRDWFQLTLKEGLTVFRDQEFSSDMGSRDVQRIEDVIELRSRQFAEDSGPMAHPIRPESYIAMDNFYTLTVYEKGAEVIRMYQTILGRDGFRKGMDLYFKRHDGQAVTCDDFRAAMSDANGYDFSQFERWYTQAGTPTVEVMWTKYDPEKKTFTFRLKQSTLPTPKQETKLPFHIPVVAGLIGRESKTEIHPSTVLHFKEEEQDFSFDNVAEPPLLSIMRNYSAPVKLVFNQPDEDLAFQIGHDTDSFNRWDAGQELALRILLERSKQISAGKLDPSNPPALPEVMINAFRQLLNQQSLDLSFKSYALLLPVSDMIANHMRPCDPVAIHQARKSMRSQLLAALKSDMQRTYDELTKAIDAKPFKVLPACENVAPRQLRNLLLSYLSSDGTPEAVSLAWNHFDKAKNMTDRLTALRCLVETKTDEREKALEKFYKDAAGDDLVLDKWFSIQAGSDSEEVLDNIVVLMKHPKFTMKTPSRMRSLISRYAMNSAHFHRSDGRGYKFVADAVLEIDDFNGAIAAKLASCLIDWKIYDVSRQTLMKQELERIMNSGKLKPETYEIVLKGLEL